MLLRLLYIKRLMDLVECRMLFIIEDTMIQKQRRIEISVFISNNSKMQCKSAVKTSMISAQSNIRLPATIKLNS